MTGCHVGAGTLAAVGPEQDLEVLVYSLWPGSEDFCGEPGGSLAVGVDSRGIVDQLV